jgi:hypothetical protein
MNAASFEALMIAISSVDSRKKVSQDQDRAKCKIRTKDEEQLSSLNYDYHLHTDPLHSLRVFRKYPGRNMRIARCTEASGEDPAHGW